MRILGGDGTQVFNNAFGRGSGGEVIPNESSAIFAGRFSASDEAVDADIGDNTPASENVISNSGGDAIELGLGADDFTIARNTGDGNGSGQAGDEFIDLQPGANDDIAKPVITSARRSAVSGTADPNATIRIFAASSRHGSIQSFIAVVAAAGDGSWTFNYPVLRPVGELITVSQTDLASGGDTSELALPVRTGLDGPAPTVFVDGGPASGETTTDSTPTFEFSSNVASATFECRYEFESFAPCSSPFTHAPLSYGGHIFSVRAKDGALFSSVGGSNFIVDATAETAITSGPANGSSSTDRTPTFEFSSPDEGATFKCRIDGANFAPCSGPGASHTSATLADGTHTFRVRATDALGNVDSTPATRTFTVDRVAPETTITSGPAAGAKINDTTPTFGFSSSEAGSTFECRIDGAAFAPCSGPGAKHTPAALADGQHTFKVRATDAAGNTDATQAERTFKVDTVAPETTITSGPAEGSTTSDSTPTFGFSSSESGSTFECRIDGANFAPCSGPGATHTPAALADGQHTFKVRATDTAGNKDATQAQRTFTVDA
jgi:Big-like domain-containing protein